MLVLIFFRHPPIAALVNDRWLIEHIILKRRGCHITEGRMSRPLGLRESRKWRQLLIKAMTSFLTALSICLSMDRILLTIMRKDGVQMAHLDPTEIISHPIPIEATMHYIRISIMTTIIISCIGSILVWHDNDIGGGWGRVIPNLLRSIMTASIGIACFGIMIFFTALLCGASPWVDRLHTFLASLYVACLAFGPSLVFDAERYVQLLSGKDQPLVRLLCGPSAAVQNQNKASQNPWEVIDSFALYGVFVAVIPTMILRILDHGDQIQRWPIPMLLGSSVGYCIGSALGILSSFVLLRRKITDRIGAE